LEHPTVPAAFTRDRLLSCRLITQQAAISMETAKLYSTMEARVAQRTAQLHRATQEARDAHKHAEHCSQAKSTFLANMSHEIRTPMNGVLGAAELFDPSSSATEQRDLISIIKSSGQAMLVLINDILDLSKIEAGKIELEESDVDIRACVESAIDVVAQKALQKGLDIIARVAPDVPLTIRCDGLRLKQVFFNLLRSTSTRRMNGRGRVYATPEPHVYFVKGSHYSTCSP
jgi:signal transduction histidine kinase